MNFVWEPGLYCESNCTEKQRYTNENVDCMLRQAFYVFAQPGWFARTVEVIGREIVVQPAGHVLLLDAAF